MPNEIMLDRQASDNLKKKLRQTQNYLSEDIEQLRKADASSRKLQYANLSSNISQTHSKLESTFKKMKDFERAYDEYAQEIERFDRDAAQLLQNIPEITEWEGDTGWTVDLPDITLLAWKGVQAAPLPVGKQLLTDSDVDIWVKYFNDWAKENDAIAIESTGLNTYKTNPAAREKIVVDILKDKQITSEQAEYLFNKFGISKDVINTVLKDKHYKKVLDTQDINWRIKGQKILDVTVDDLEKEIERLRKEFTEGSGWNTTATARAIAKYESDLIELLEKRKADLQNSIHYDPGIGQQIDECNKKIKELTGSENPAIVNEEPGEITTQMMSDFGWNVSSTELTKINDTLQQYGITDPRSIRLFMATCAHESGKGTSGALEGLNKDGTTVGNYKKTERGAGYIQITWEATHRKFLATIPDSFSEADTATYIAKNYPWEAAAWFWSSTDAKQTSENLSLNDYVVKYGDSKGVFLISQYLINGWPDGLDNSVAFDIRDGKVSWTTKNGRLYINGVDTCKVPNGWDDTANVYNRENSYDEVFKSFK